MKLFFGSDFVVDKNRGGHSPDWIDFILKQPIWA